MPQDPQDPAAASTEVESPHALERFFADLTRQPTSVFYRGVHFETLNIGNPNLLTALAFWWWYALVSRFSSRRRGVHVHKLSFV